MLDNNLFIKKKNIGRDIFDENYFLFFETLDFTRQLRLKSKKLYIIKKIRFNHFGASSLPKKFDNLVKKTRAFHYNWSKFSDIDLETPPKKDLFQLPIKN